MGNSIGNIRRVCSLPCNKKKEWKAGSACRWDGAGVFAKRPSLLVKSKRHSGDTVGDTGATALMNALTTATTA
jgi:hypothetical protein